MKLTHSCIITKNIKELSQFYENILNIKAQFYSDNYVEFPTEGATLSIFDYDEHEKLANGSATPCSNKCLELEFEVINIKDAYKKIVSSNIQIVKPLTTQPWGNCSFYFRDPDGNLINFYTKIK